MIGVLKHMKKYIFEKGLKLKLSLFYVVFNENYKSFNMYNCKQ